MTITTMLLSYIHNHYVMTRKTLNFIRQTKMKSYNRIDNWCKYLVRELTPKFHYKIVYVQQLYEHREIDTNNYLFTNYTQTPTT